MNVLMCIDELVPHFGPGTILAARAPAVQRRGHHVVAFVERPVAPENQYRAALRGAGVELYEPSLIARAADHWSRLNHLLLLLLLPLRLLLTLADMLLRGRPPGRAWAGVRGWLNRLLPAAQLGNPLRWALFAALDREHRRHPADLVHMHTGNGSGFAWAARRGVPIVYNENIVPSPDHGVDWWDDVRRYVDQVSLTTPLCAAAEPAMRTFLGYRGPIAVVPSSVSDPLANGAAVARDAALTGTVLLGSAARLSPVKGFDVLLRALSLTLQRCGGRSVQLWIAGDGAERSALQALADELGVSAQVRFLGHCGPTEMARFWAAVDVFVLASRWEGIPLAILEAMAHGTPVVATAVDGVPEAVLDGETGLLVPPDAVEPLAAALLALIESDTRRAALGRAGRARYLSTFRTEVVVDRLLAAYRQVVPHAA